jgi:hypothetical protein
MLVAAPAAAQNFRSVPLGGRTATMGGAGVAAGVDAAMPYLNPAGVAGTPYDVFSVSADVYSYSQSSAPHYFVPTTLDARFGALTINRESLVTKEFVQTPSGIAYFKRFGNDSDPILHVLALSLTATNYSETETAGSFRADGPTGRLNVDLLASSRFRTFLAGPSYALRIGKRVRLGMSALLTYSDVIADSQLFWLSTTKTPTQEDPRMVSQRSMFDYYSIGATGIAGIQVEAADNFWLGATAEMFGVPISGGGNLVQTTDLVDMVTNPDGTQTPVAARETFEGRLSNARVSRPMRFSLGAAYQSAGNFTIAGDVHLMPARASFRKLDLGGDVLTVQTGKPGSFMRGAESFQYGTRFTANFSVGGEIFLSSSTSLRAGFLTDFDVNEVRAASSATNNDRLDWFHFTLGLGRRDGDIETTYGLAYKLGRGTWVRNDLFGPNPDAVVNVDYRAHGAMLILSGAVRTDPGTK